MSHNIDYATYRLASEEQNPGGVNLYTIVKLSIGVIIVNVGQIWLPSSVTSLSSTAWKNVGTAPSQIIPTNTSVPLDGMVFGNSGQVLCACRALIDPITGTVKIKPDRDVAVSTGGFFGVSFHGCWLGGTI